MGDAGKLHSDSIHGTRNHSVYLFGQFHDWPVSPTFD